MGKKELGDRGKLNAVNGGEEKREQDDVWNNSSERKN